MYFNHTNTLHFVIDPDLNMGPVKSDRMKAIARRRHEAIEKIQQGLTELGESF